LLFSLEEIKLFDGSEIEADVIIAEMESSKGSTKNRNLLECGTK
jgi:hypothetical protein